MDVASRGLCRSVLSLFMGCVIRLGWWLMGRDYSTMTVSQPPVVDGLHGDTEVLGEFLDPDEGLQPQFLSVHAHQVCEPNRAAPKAIGTDGLGTRRTVLHTCSM